MIDYRTLIVTIGRVFFFLKITNYSKFVEFATKVLTYGAYHACTLLLSDVIGLALSLARSIKTRRTRRLRKRSSPLLIKTNWETFKYFVQKGVDFFSF